MREVTRTLSSLVAVTTLVTVATLVACGGAQKPKPPPVVNRTTVVATFADDGSIFSGGLAWKMTMECGTGQTYTLESNGFVLGGRWVVEWPMECGDRRPTVEVDLRANWMACEPVNGFTQMLDVGKDLTIPVTCTERPQ